MSHLVTGDAVVLGLQPARLPSRAMAIALDLVVILGGYLLLSVVLLSTVLSLGTAATMAVQVALVLLLLVGGPIAVETLSRGRSLGKLAFGLRVVRADGGPIRFRHALVRGAIGFIEILATLGSVACIASLVSAEGRRLGDVFAGTLVVRERIPAGRSAPLPPPPPMVAGQFASLDLSRVPDGLWLAVRQFLSRLGQLDAQVAWSMAVRLAEDVMGRVGTPAPAGMHPAAYLSGVAAERQRREAERAFGRGAAAGPLGGGMPAGPAGPVIPGATLGPPQGIPGAPVPPGGPAWPDGAVPPGMPGAPAPPYVPPAGERPSGPPPQGPPAGGGGFTPPS
ncbi:RDD family protein [Streptomyces sp. DSM 44917]|uniref:RDD family protein n=1 Tax=Streptomyces boetiae TaxID=3075541 RepID=A0ABU2LF59_9ACTN|nr:RDD family protein [Streptomyces sp. DSM 44917]MDT0310225.1 RDD family protein [Streptomyces sp. DSM 44917]